MSARYSTTRTSLRTAAIMIVFTLVFTALMASTYRATRPAIEASKQDAQLRLINEILPPDSYDNALLDERGGLLSLTKQMRKGRPLGLSLTVAVVLPEGRDLEGRIEDAGFGGLEVSLSEPLPMGEIVGIRLDQGKLQLDTSARCVWCHPIDDLKDRWLAGLRLTGQAKDQFAQLRELILALVRSTH